MTKKKVMVGMSGGVDSSVAALLLLKAGYDVTGVTMQLCPEKHMSNDECSSFSDIDDARKVAHTLGIDHVVLNFTDIFQKNVINYFVDQYSHGLTPNPCIVCNRRIKFGAMLEYAKELNFDYIATGHYAIIEQNPQGRWLLKKAPANKDQSYFLYTFTQEQLSHTLMPLGKYSKLQARKMAEDSKLPVAHKPDSQEICFVEDNDYASFIKNHTGKTALSGNFIDNNGNIIGRHLGIPQYTIGQRKGLGISFGKPMYVTKIDTIHNEITLGEEGGQYSNSLIASNLNFIPFDTLDKEIQITAKIRYQAKPANAKLIPLGNDKVRVEFEQPQRAVTPGQAVVFYDGDIIIGGGTIQTQ